VSNFTKLEGRDMVASCVLAVSNESALGGTGLSGASALRVARDVRPTKALAVAAQAQAYVQTVAGAGLQVQAWAIDGFAGGTTTATEQHQKMRAYRGPDPWQEPA
jgi:hypothetical protein